MMFESRLGQRVSEIDHGGRLATLPAGGQVVLFGCRSRWELP
jgi:hypothetical protein